MKDEAVTTAERVSLPASSAQFTTEELATAAKAAFGVQPEVIRGALLFKYKGKRERFTKAEATAAIQEFKAKEVK